MNQAVVVSEEKKETESKESKKEDILRIEIDPLRLDTEWRDQPSQFLFWSEKLAEARLIVDVCKSSLEVAKAELDKDIRNNPEEFDLPKLTETVIANTIILQPKYARHLKLFNEARYDQGMIQAAVDGLDQRKRALENLVTLHGMNYFAEPKATGDVGQELKDLGTKRIRSMWRSTKREEPEEK